MKKLIVALFICLFSYNSFASSIIARVGDKAVTKFDVVKRANMLILINPDLAKMPESTMKKIALDQIINEYVYKLEAKNLKISLDSDEKRRAIEYVEIENKLPKGSFLAFVKSKNLDPEHVKDHLETQMLWQKIVHQHIRPQVKVTENEIKKMITDPSAYKFTTVSVVADNTITNNERLNKIITNKMHCSIIEKIKDKDLKIVKQHALLTEFRPEFALHLTTQKPGATSNIINIDDKISIIQICDKSVYLPKEKMYELKARISADKTQAMASMHLTKAKRKTLIEYYN